MEPSSAETRFDDQPEQADGAFPAALPRDVRPDVAGATLVFNLVVWLLFAVLWLALLAAIALAPASLGELWKSVRRRTLAIQAVVWLLFLPIMTGIWIWRRPWTPLIRLTLLVALGAWNLFLFFPR
jgi:hypothetical protein